MHLFQPFLDRVRQTPGAVFCHLLRGGAHVAITRGEMAASAAAMAARLAAAGVGAGQVVPIMLEHRAELYSSFIGCSLAGAVPSFLPPPTPRQDPGLFAAATAALLARIDPPCIIASAATARAVAAAGRKMIDVDTGPAGAAAIPAALPPAPGAPALLQHSSGTTGLKKGVCLSHVAVLRQIGRYAAAIGLADSDCVASWLPLYHDMGLVTGFLMPALAGTPIVSLDAQEWVLRPDMLLDAIARFHASLCWLPNFAFHHIARLAEPGRHWDLTSLRLLVNCSEPCRAAAFDGFLARFASSGVTLDRLQTSYAMAENVFAITQSRPGTAVRHSRRAEHAGILSSGVPLDGMELRIGQDGEIALRSDCLFGGYFRQPDITAARLRDGWYHTGDIGFIEEGELFVVGRLDDVLTVNGRKLLAHELEDEVSTLPGVAPGRVLAYADFDPAIGTQRLMLAVEPAFPVPDGLAGAIRRHVMGVAGLRPHGVAFLARGFLVKSTSGKIARAASLAKIREHAERRADAGGDLRAPGGADPDHAEPAGGGDHPGDDRR